MKCTEDQEQDTQGKLNVNVKPFQIEQRTKVTFAQISDGRACYYGECYRTVHLATSVRQHSGKG